MYAFGKGKGNAGKYGKGQGSGKATKGTKYRPTGKGWSSGGGGKYMTPGQSSHSEWAKKIEWKDRMAKWLLRPFVNEAGSPFGIKNMTDMECLRPENFAQLLGNTCSEYCWRSGFAMSEGGATIDVAAKPLVKYGTIPSDASVDAIKNQLDFIGITTTAAHLNTPEGKAFLAANKYFNTAQDMERTDQLSREHTKKWLRFLRTNHSEKAQAFTRLAMFSARAYLLSIELLEATAAVNRPDVMANGMRELPKSYVTPQTAAWLRNAGDLSAMVDALASNFMAQKIYAQEVEQAADDAFEAGTWEQTAAWDGQNEDEDDIFGDSSDVAGWGSGSKSAGSSKRAVGGHTGKGSGGTANASSAAAVAKKRKKDPLEASDDERIAAAGLLASDDEESEDDEAPDPEVVKVAAYVKWSEGEAKILQESMEAALTKVNDKKERLSLDELRQGLGSVPPEMLSLHGLQADFDKLGKMQRLPKPERLKPLYEKILEMAKDARAYYLAQQKQAVAAGKQPKDDGKKSTDTQK